MGGTMTGLRREERRELIAYSPAALPGVDLDLRDNVNPWGAPPAALRAMGEQRIDVSCYPDHVMLVLRELIGLDAGVGAAEVVVGCGSDDVIDAFLRAMTHPGDRIAHPDPTFGMVRAFALLNGLEAVGVPLLPGGAMDVDGMIATGARVIYACSPNNPTGTVTPQDDIRRLIARAPGVVLVDEAYAEFADDCDLRAEAPTGARVLVTRTFSKAWGLAGLRIGYGVGAASLVDAIATARGPYKVNSLAAQATAAALREEGAWMRARAADARSIRDALISALASRRGVRPWASSGNFVFATVDGSAAEVARRFAALGIGVRAFESLRGIGSAVRFGLVRREAVPRLVRAFDEVWPCA